MRSTLSGWEVELAQWLKPFLDRLGQKARRRMCPLCVTGLIGPAIARVFSRWRRDLHEQLPGVILHDEPCRQFFDRAGCGNRRCSGHS